MKAKIILGMLVLSVLMGGCGKDDISFMERTEQESESQYTSDSTDKVTVDSKEMFTERDRKMSYEETECIPILLKKDTVQADSQGIVIDGTTVKITKGGTYLISGELQNGMLVIEASEKEKVQLVLDNVTIHNEAFAAIYVKSADKVFLTLAENSTNILSNGGSFETIDENNIDAVVFAKQDITINGLGSLQVTSPAGNGIAAKDDLVVIGADITVTAASHAIEANDSVRMANVTLTAQAGKDGIHAENSEDTSLGFVYMENVALVLEAEGDGISAGSTLQIAGGTVEITAGGGSKNGTKQSSDDWGGFPGGGHKGPGRNDVMGSTASEQDDSTSMKGMKAAASIVIEDGSFVINAADDAIHSDMELSIKSGKFELASGDDAIHAEETLTISGGNINISESYEGIEALHIVIEGGEISLIAEDDGLNAAGGVDASGTDGGRDGMFGGMGGPGGPGGRQPGGMQGGAGSSKGSIIISDGVVVIQASGDGIDANGSLEISGGYVVSAGPTRGDTAILDYDTSAVITGGTFIGTGALGMTQSFSDAKQGLIAVSVGSQSAGTVITVQDKEGQELISHAPQLDYQVVIISSPQLKSGESYTMTIGTASADVTAQ